MCNISISHKAWRRSIQLLIAKNNKCTERLCGLLQRGTPRGIPRPNRRDREGNKIILEEEGLKEYYDQDYNYLSAQLKKAKQHLDQIQVREEDKRR